MLVRSIASRIAQTWRLVASMPHEWEDAPEYPSSADAQHPWDDMPTAEFDERWGSRWDFDDVECKEALKEVAVREFLDVLESLYMYSKISAEQFCTLCYFAALGGLGEEVARFGQCPGKPSGHYSRFLKSKFQMATKSQEHYSMNVPC